MDHRITQCPRCGTSFRVTEAHLAVAAGAVRCGSCLHIFNAREHWAEDIASTPAQAPAATPEPEPDLDDLVIDDDALFDDNTPLFAQSEEEPAHDKPLYDPVSRRQEPLFNEIDFGTLGELDGGSLRQAESTTASDAEDDFSLIEDAPEELTGAFSDVNSWEEDSSTRFGRVQDLDADLSASDEEWARDLLRDDEPLFANDSWKKGDSAAPVDNPSAPAAGSWEGDSDDLAAEPTPSTGQPALEDFGLVAAEWVDGRREPTFGEVDATDEGSLGASTGAVSVDPGDDALEFLENDPLLTGSLPADPDLESAAAEAPERGELDLNEEFLDTPSALRATENSDAPISALDNDEPETIVTDASYIAPGPAANILSARASGADTDHNPLASLDRLASEPLQIHRLKHEPRWPGVLWSLAAFALAAALASQYVYKNFDSLARGQARPWLVQACNVAGCALPPQADVSQIRSGNLIVRSHPNRPGALVVDAIITNLASFPQPYPQLQLQFSDFNGAPVAGRRFQPAEYLAGELSGAALMPVQQPVHVALELVDPGPQAVNYALTVVAPSTTP